MTSRAATTGLGDPALASPVDRVSGRRYCGVVIRGGARLSLLLSVLLACSGDDPAPASFAGSTGEHGADDLSGSAGTSEGTSDDAREEWPGAPRFDVGSDDRPMAPGILELRRGLADGRFAGPITVDVGRGPHQLVLASLGRDGQRVALVSAQGSTTIEAIAWEHGLLASSTLIEFAGRMAVGRFDGDDVPDIFLVGSSMVGPGTSFARGQGDGTVVVGPELGGPQSFDHHLLVLDPDRSGEAYVVAVRDPVDCGDEKLTIEVWTLQDTGFALHQRIRFLPESNMSPHVADLTADGRDDLLLWDHERLLMFPGEKTGRLGPVRQPVLGIPRAITQGDLDADGDIDLVLGFPAATADAGSPTASQGLLEIRRREQGAFGTPELVGLSDPPAWLRIPSAPAHGIAYGLVREHVLEIAWTRQLEFVQAVPYSALVELGDLDGDNIDDLVIVVERAYDEVREQPSFPLQQSSKPTSCSTNE